MNKLLLLLCLTTLFQFVGCGSTVEDEDAEDTSGGNGTDSNGTDNGNEDGGDDDDDGQTTDSTDVRGSDDDVEVLPEPLLIQAECAISGFSGDCNGAYTGGTSESEAVWGQAPSYPNLDPSSDTIVGFFNGGTWIRIDGVDLTEMNTIKMQLANGSGADGQFEIRLGSPDGMRIATVNSPITGETDDWSIFQTVTQVLQGSFTGLNNVYVLAANADIGNGNLDWLEFSADPNVQIDTDIGAASARIQAECALGADVGDCNGTYTGDTSHSPAIWEGAVDYPALDPANPSTVGYFTDGSWIRIDGVDFTGITSITVSVSGLYDGTGFYVYLDSLDSSAAAAIPVGNTGDWSVFTEVQKPLNAVYTGLHNVFFLGESPAETQGVGNIDWFELQ